VTTITPEGMPADGLFGAEFALMGDELWVAAPLHDQNRGSIYRFVRDGATSEWRSASGPLVTGLEPNFVLGASLALGENIAVAGAPAAYGGVGRAAVFTRDGMGWSAAQWLTLGDDLDVVAGEEVMCSDGEAAGFDCNNVDLQAFLPLAAMGAGPGERVSDIWGWTDPQTGREYALVGRTNGAAFVDVTNPTDPVYLGIVEANPSGARDLKVYRDHLFFTGDGAGDHGLVVFNLARLRDVTNAPQSFEPDARYDQIASAHNLIIDTEAGFAYPVGASGGGQTCGGGLHMINIQDPLNPTFAGCYTDTEGLIWQGRTHDGQCVVYEGPDTRYHGREICFASNETALRIVDVTDKQNPEPLAAATYPGLAYVHQGWLSDDQRYFYLDDELDELVGQTDRTRTMVWDIAELDDPVLVSQYLGPDGATDHNLYVKGNRMYQANYQAGFRLVDITQPENPVEIGHFDTTPYEGNPPGFNGAWTAYPYFDSGTVIVSSMNEGLFVLKPRTPVLVP
jgi:choice-of-anchor B domain-containing protein